MMIRGPHQLGPEGFPFAPHLNIGDIYAAFRGDSRQLELDAIAGGRRAGDKLGDTMSERITAKLKAAVPAAVGAAVGAAIGTTASQTIGLGDAMARLQARTGKTNDEVADYEKRMKALYAANYGDDFEQLADAITLVESSLGLTGEAADSVVRKGLALQKTFGRGLEEQMRGAQNLVRNFGIDGDAAMDLIAAGLQRGGQGADDLLDTFNEYSTTFRDMGYDGEQFLDMLLEGLEDGARNTDLIADAIKEFDIRIRDGSTSTREALRRLGIDFQQWEQALGSGAMTGADALQLVEERLSTIDDSLVREQVGVALYGTKWEDLGEQVIRSVNQADGAVSDLEGTAARVDEAIFSGPTSAFEAWRRSIETTVASITGQLFPVLKDMGPILAGFGPLLTPVIAGFGGFIGEGLRRAWGSTAVQGAIERAMTTSTMQSLMGRIGTSWGGWLAGAAGGAGLIGAVSTAVAAMAPLAIPVIAHVALSDIRDKANADFFDTTDALELGREIKRLDEERLAIANQLNARYGEQGDEVDALRARLDEINAALPGMVTRWQELSGLTPTEGRDWGEVFGKGVTEGMEDAAETDAPATGVAFASGLADGLRRGIGAAADAVNTGLAAIRTEAAQERLDHLRESIAAVASTMRRDIVRASKDSMAAIRQAFRDQSKPLEKLAREERKLARLRRQAQKEGRFDIVAMIDTRLGEIRTLEDQIRTTNKHYRNEASTQKKRRDDLDKLQTKFGVTREKALAMWRAAGRNVAVAIDTEQANRRLDALKTKIASLYQAGNATITVSAEARAYQSKPRKEALGGPVVGHRPYLVGERGPELYVPDRNGRIINNDDVRAALGSGGGGDTHYHANITGLPMRARTPREVVQQQRRAARFGIMGLSPAPGFEPV